ncbi:CRISPR-associated protein Cas4 [Castellaniella sp. GW247-6E4]|uniref:CRISPR-associated protein Cas4 n=1 Tax=Castellaniella sp. GW247-6E4 TaxID=3140380 RepID=UPI003314BFFC
MEDTPIPLSALQYYLCCPRQCALIHLEQQWEENVFTAEGRLLHEHVDQPGGVSRAGVRTVRALQITHPGLGFAGVADVVEFHAGPGGECANPVEYKRGKPKAHRADEVQLCAQALCLEAMFGHEIAEGVLFYGRNRRRQVVPPAPALRALTLEAIDWVRSLLAARRTPSAVYERQRCDACSLIDVCLPRLLGRSGPVRDWLRTQLEEET